MECCHPANDDHDKCSIYQISTYIVPSVHGGSALQEKVNGGDRREVADGISPNRGGVSGASKVEGSGASATLGPHAHKLIHSLLHIIHLNINTIKYHGQSSTMNGGHVVKVSSQLK